MLFAITAITFASVNCEAEDPCSVNTAYAPESSFTLSPRSTTRPVLWFQLGILEMTSVHHCSKVDFPFFSFCPSRITSFLLFILSNCHAGNFSSSSHYMSIAAFASRIFIAWSIGNKLVHQIVMT